MAALGLLVPLVGCMPAAPDRGLERELATARAQAAFEQTRVRELENRLTRLEANSQAAPNPAANDSTTEQQLNLLIALNQQLLLETQANREQRAQPAPAPAPPPPSTAIPTQSTLRSTPLEAPECNAGLTTEEKILQLVLSLKGERSPWRVDGLSYEESQALRVLLREERALDRDNPWQ